jgi:hypothetical protein
MMLEGTLDVTVGIPEEDAVDERDPKHPFDGRREQSTAAGDEQYDEQYMVERVPVRTDIDRISGSRLPRR